MSEQLIIKLGSHADEPIDWLVWSTHENEIIASGVLTSADDMQSLQQRVNLRTATVLVPASDCVLKQLATPGKANKQFILALPYAMEEDLATDVDELFFATGRQFNNGEQDYIEVAAVAIEKMQTWLNWLADAGIQAHVMRPDCLALPYFEQGISLIQVGNQWLIRHHEFGGFNCRQDELNFWLNELNNQGQATTLHCYSPLPDGIEVDLEPVEHDFLPAMQVLNQYINQSQLNLRQGRFAFKKDTAKYIKIWRNAAILAAVALTINLAFKGVSVYQLNAQAEQIEEQIRTSYSRVFPNGKNLSTVIMRKQLQRELANLGGGEQGVSVLSLFETSAKAFASVPELKPENFRFDFKRGEIRLNVRGPNFQSFEKFKAVAEQNNLKVEQGSLNNQGSQVVGAISIRSMS
ncbi:type II secretion system protein GspL [Gayadomonas joobiniege]|uniref:type II secretion system protein GspL n=1 Tax=Gayadomonas joobiniege TaxID=1234606 RepID=UPI000381B027|nr:type II secretion system protein GspL [Gayadomonas joobiniege]